MYKGLKTVRLIPLVGLAAYSSVSSPILNEGKRNFYEDDKEVVPVPGTVVPSSGTEIESLGPNKLVDGVSIRSSSAIESFFGNIRQNLLKGTDYLQERLNEGYAKYNTTERRVSNQLSELHEKSEDLLPNSIYVVIAVLSGNIFARQRNILAKATFPVVLGVASFKYFLPQTFSNVKDFIWSVEKQKIPAVASQQEYALSKASEFAHKIEETSASSQRRVHNGVSYLKRSISDITGLNIDEEVSKK